MLKVLMWKDGCDFDFADEEVDIFIFRDVMRRIQPMSWFIAF